MVNYFFSFLSFQFPQQLVLALRNVWFSKLLFSLMEWHSRLKMTWFITKAFNVFKEMTLILLISFTPIEFNCSQIELNLFEMSCVLFEMSAMWKGLICKWCEWIVIRIDSIYLTPKTHCVSKKLSNMHLITMFEIKSASFKMQDAQDVQEPDPYSIIIVC